MFKLVVFSLIDNFEVGTCEKFENRLEANFGYGVEVCRMKLRPKKLA